jgi:hypothetical protein
MPQTKYYLTHGGQIDSVTLAPTDVLATIETPDGVDPIRAAVAIASGRASANPPATKADAPAPIPPHTKLPATK